MRLAGLKSVLFGVSALLVMGAFTGCENPFDPLGKSDKIEGLTYIDFSATWERWDSDPQGDGLVVSLTYSNEFGDSLSFNDKSHKVVIEFWTQKDLSAGTEPTPRAATIVKDKLFYTKTIDFENSDDEIRIPIEAYYQALVAAFPASDDAAPDFAGFMVVRVFPPQQYPRTELLVAQPDVVFFVPEEAENTPNL
jgi:hypothetical protein